MLGPALGGQVSWLLPFALLAAVALVIATWRRPRTDVARASVALWAGWLVLELVVLSFQQGIQHPYYAAAMAPPLAALAGIGAVFLAQAGRRSARWRWALPALVAVTGAWAVVLLRRTPGWQPWLPWLVAAACVVAAAWLLLPPAGHIRVSPGRIVWDSKMSVPRAKVGAPPGGRGPRRQDLG
jgi:4-amino-4-deoxy-L-arabinose transferase-like glycosyltransferase